MSDTVSSQRQLIDSNDVLQADLVPARRPGPGFWAAVGCCLLVPIAQTTAVMPAVVVWGFLAGLRGGAPPSTEALLQSIPITLTLGAGATGVLLCAILAVLAVFRRQAPRYVALRGASPVQWLMALLMVLPLSVVGSEISNWVSAVVPNLLGTFEMLMQLSRESPTGAILFGSLFAAVGEELYFRGLIGRGLVARYGAWGGVLLTSLLFGAVHVEPAQACGAAVVGLGLHGTYLCTRSMYVPMAVHFLNNAAAFTAIRFSDRLQLPGYVPGPDNALQFTPWPVTLAAVAALGGLAWAFWDSRSHYVQANGQRWDPGFVTAEMPPETLDTSLESAHPGLPSLVTVLITQALLLVALWQFVQWDA